MHRQMSQRSHPVSQQQLPSMKMLVPKRTVHTATLWSLDPMGLLACGFLTSDQLWYETASALWPHSSEKYPHSASASHGLG